MAPCGQLCTHQFDVSPRTLVPSAHGLCHYNTSLKGYRLDDSRQSLSSSRPPYNTNNALVVSTVVHVHIGNIVEMRPYSLLLLIPPFLPHHSLLLYSWVRLLLSLFSFSLSSPLNHAGMHLHVILPVAAEPKSMSLPV